MAGKLEGFTRKKFLFATFAVAVDLSLQSVLKVHADGGNVTPIARDFYFDDLEGLLPNKRAGMNDLFKLPDTVFKHSREPVSTAVNFKTMYREDKSRFPDHVNLDKTEKGDIDGYGQGIREAIKRGDDVTLVLEFPGFDNRKIDVEDWRLYCSGLSDRFSGCTRIILGGEINIDQQVHLKRDPKKYVDLFDTAKLAVKRLSPKTKILMYSEAYNEDGETLKGVLKEMKERFGFIPVDGLVFNFYDRAGLLPERAKLYRKIANDFGIPDIPIFIRELGKIEGVDLTSCERERAVVQETATALSLPENNAGISFWYSAYTVNPHDHSLTNYNSRGELKKSPAFDAYWDVSKLLHHDVGRTVYDNITEVCGVTSDGRKTKVIWNNVFDEKRIAEKEYEGRRLLSSTNEAYEGDTVITIERKNPNRRKLRIPIDI